VGFSRRVPPERSFAGDRQPNRRDLTLQRNELRSFEDKRLDERLAFRWRSTAALVRRIGRSRARRYTSRNSEGGHDG